MLLMGKPTTGIKREGGPRLKRRCIADLAAMQQLVDKFKDDHDKLCQDIEVTRRIWEMKFQGMQPTEISRTLRQGPPWAWRSVWQVRYTLEPGNWSLNDGGKEEGQGQ